MTEELMNAFHDLAKGQRWLIDTVERLAEEVHGTGSEKHMATCDQLACHREACAKAEAHISKFV